MKCVYILTCYALITANTLKNEKDYEGLPDNDQEKGAITLEIEESYTASDDLVTRSELRTFLSAVEKILDYYSYHSVQIDMNVYYGLFVMKVFLNQFWNKPITGLSASMLHKLYGVMRKQEYLCTYFQKKIKTDEQPGDTSNKRIYSLINDYAPWVSNLKKLQTNAWEEPMLPEVEIEKIYSNWSVYSREVMNIFNSNNTNLVPRLVATCLENISLNPKNYTDPSRGCTDSDECRYLIQNEVDFGYIVTHKLMVLQNAHYGRGCYIYSKNLDEELAKRYCQAMFAEAMYIVKHDIDNSFTDLHMEQTMLCGLEGYADFLRKTWISRILKIQDSSGCIKFNRGTKNSLELNVTKDIVKNTNNIIDEEKKGWQIVKVPKLDLMENIPCNVHTSGLAVGTLSLAIRFLFETTLPVVLVS